MWTHQNVREIGTKPRFRRGLFEGRGLRFWHIQEEFHAMFNFWKLEIYIEMRSNNCLENWTSYIILLCEKCDWILCWYDINLIQPTKPNAHRVWINKALLRNKLIKLLQSCKFFPAIVNCGVWSGGGNAKRGICGECRGSISSERPPDRAFPVPGSVQLQHPIGGFKYPFRLVDGNPFHHFRLCWKLLKYWKKLKQFPCKQTEVAKPASWNLDEKDSSAWPFSQRRAVSSIAVRASSRKAKYFDSRVTHLRGGLCWILPWDSRPRLDLDCSTLNTQIKDAHNMIIHWHVYIYIYMHKHTHIYIYI